MLPAAGAVLGILISAQAAHAAGLDVQYTGPATPTTADLLTWAISTTDSSPTSCELDRGPTVVSALTDCGPSASYDVSAEPAGSYTLVVYNALAADVPGDPTLVPVTSSIDVHPVAPSPTGPSGPSNDTTPTWDPGLPAGTTGTCTVTDPANNPVIGPEACSDPYTADLGSSPPDGDYTLTVTATQNTLSSDPAQVTYTLDTTKPAPATVTAPSSPDNDKTPTFGISGVENGATVTCTATGPNGALPVSSCTTTSAGLDLTGAGHPDGDYTLTVVVHDDAGNDSDPASDSYTLDSTGPTTPVITPGSAAGKSHTPSFTVSEPDAGVTWDCTVTGPVTASTTACGPTTTLDLVGLPDGDYTLTVTVADALGNTSSATATYHLDSTGPTAPTVTGPTSGSHNSRTPSFSVDEPDGDATLTCDVTGPGAASVTACGSTTTLDISGGDGTYTLTITATDPYGNEVTSTVTYTLDTTAPPPPSVTPPGSPTNNKQPTVAISDSVSGVALTCVLTAPGGATVFSGACPGGGVFDTRSYGDGTYTLVVTATDAAGNFSTTTVTWDRDTAAPPNPDVSAPPALTNSKTVTLSISDTEAGVNLTCRLTGPDGVLLNGACPVGGTFDTNGHPDGTYTLVVTATDDAGNTSTTTVSWVRDTADPPPPSVTPPGSPTNNKQPTVAISDSESGVALTCVLTAPGGATVFSGVCPGGGVFDTRSYGDGTYTLVVTATDAAGNFSTTTVTWDRDTAAPPNPDVSAPPALTNSKTVTLSISDTEAGVTLTCVLTAPGGAVVRSGACPGDGTFNTNGFGDGTYTLVVTATDAAGNTSTTTVSWDRDITPPPSPTVPAPPGLTNSKTVTLSISDSESGVTLTCTFLGPGAVLIASGGCPGDGVFDTTNHGDGQYTVVVTATDPAGNTSTTTVSWMQDTAAPPTPGVSAPTSPNKGRNPSFTVTEPEAGVTFICTVDGPAPATVTQCGLTTTLHLSGADGIYTLTVIAVDAAGNQSLAGTATYGLDTTAPPAPDVSAPPALTNSKTVTLTIGDTEPGVAITCVLTAPGGATVFSGTCPGDGAFNTNGYADGVYTLVVTATDAADNSSSTTVSWTRDTQAPPTPVVAAPPSPGNTRSPSFSVTEPEGGVTWACTVSGPSVVTITACGPTITLDLSGAAEGTYTVTITATDAAGNTSAAGSASWTLDTIAPPAPTVTAPTSPGKSRTPSFTVTDPEAGVHWSCSVTGPSSVTVTTCGPTTTLNMSGAADGTYTVSVYAIDPAGNQSLAGTAVYVLDTTPPPAPVVTPPASPSKDTTPTYAISDTEAGVVLTCSLRAPGGASVYNGPCPVDGTFDTTGFADGTYTLTVTATDFAGNSSTTIVTWVKDTQPPPVPSVSAPSSPSQNRAPSFSVSDAEGGVSYTCTVSGPSHVTVTTCGPTTTLNLSGAADGLYTVTVTATDIAGNTSAAGTATYLLDTTAPTAPGVSVTGSPSQGRHATFTVSGVETGGELTCTLTGPGGHSASISCDTTMALDLTGQPDGAYTVSVTVTDAAGNVSAKGSATYVLDTTAPYAPGVTAAPSPGNDSHPTFVVATESGARLTCTVARYFQVVFSGPCDGSVDLSAYEDGEFEITITSTDAAGNTSSGTTVVYVLDTVAPAKPVLTAPASPSPIENPVWLWTAEDGTTATCTITGPTGAIVQGPVTCASPFTGLFKRLPDGTYTLTVVLTDAAGNTSTPVTSIFILDRHAPVPPTVVPPTSPDNTHHPVWDISAPRGALLTCTLLRGHTVVYGPAECPADGQFSLAGMPDGTYTLRVTATDAAGNISATAVSTYTLDTQRPAEPELSYSSASPSTDTSPYWGFTLPAGTTGRCELWHDGELIAVKNGCKGAVSFNLSGRPAGTYTVRIYAVDGAGNTSKALVASYVLGRAGGGSPSPGGGPLPGGGGGPTGGGGGSDGPPTNPLSRHAVEQVLNNFGQLPQTVRKVAKKATHAVTGAVSSILPTIHDKVTEHVSRAVQGVVDAVSHAGGGAGFPLMLLFVVVGFLIMQNRIDRRDPKLALASVAADDKVEFVQPPSRRGRGGPEGAGR